MPQDLGTKLENPVKFDNLGGIKLHVEDGVEAFLLFFDKIGQPPLSPDIDLRHFASQRLNERLELLQKSLMIFHVGSEQKHHIVRSHLDHLLPMDDGPYRSRGREHEE